ncbi:28S ribosomal protein S18a, mitochondrial [Schistocerca cancellata]|uniref:28S ribosomal protein S18a, mitochondrial n=1 Tax=Schistocerca cancellata TaxID=274614 RepID=UPI0021181D13|nr:28S ribosomal protein S18a, mitochondrial [Schistocerca cancellata]
MMNVVRNCATASFNAFFRPRSLYTSSVLRLKEIQEKKEGKTLIIEAVTVPSPRQPLLVRTPSDGPCRLCALGLDIKHTDVLILNQFLRSDGCMLPRRITGLCKKQQRKVSILVAMAQKAGLMPNLAPSNSKRDPKRRLKWKKFNTYFDESTIKFKY